ncbi:hypothetical protein B0H11DRAFT_2426189 [Mycena galericulata]|nr:hypothetical protein B0H11DRAFT_2426189 [Mycena galericulata]
MSPLVAFIDGSGGNVGKHTAVALKAKGYKVALGSRNPAVQDIKNDGFFPVMMDAQSVESRKAAFAAVTAELGSPTVIIFNAATFEPAPIPEDPLTLLVDSLTRQTIFGLSTFAAAQEALRSKTFIVTGNPMPWFPADVPLYLGLNVQKIVEWRLVELLASAYSKENIRFYFATLTSPTGGPIEPVSDFFTSGPLHAQVYLDLITRQDQVDWGYRFNLEGKQVIKA